jgi:hypothetical protein
MLDLVRKRAERRQAQGGGRQGRCKAQHAGKGEHHGLPIPRRRGETKLSGRSFTLTAQNGQIMPSCEPGFRHGQKHDQAKGDPQRRGHAPGCQAL